MRKRLSISTGKSAGPCLNESHMKWKTCPCSGSRRFDRNSFCATLEDRINVMIFFSMSLIRPFRQSLAIAALAILSISQALASQDFRELIVRLDHEIGAPPVSLSLADGAGLLAVGQEGDDWRFSVISLSDGTVLTSGVIPEAAFFYDTGDPQDHGVDQVCFFDERGVSALDPVSGALDRVTDVASVYHGRSWLGPTYSDFVRDVDGDDTDDILIPQFEGWLLARRHETGFDRYLLQIRPRVTVNQRRISYEPPRTTQRRRRWRWAERSGLPRRHRVRHFRTRTAGQFFRIWPARPH